MLLLLLKTVMLRRVFYLHLSVPIYFHMNDSNVSLKSQTFAEISAAGWRIKT